MMASRAPVETEAPESKRMLFPTSHQLVGVRGKRQRHCGVRVISKRIERTRFCSLSVGVLLIV